jgi:D-arabinose 1-dehydrogenase-like Zn-dependent alcohol dehydrogenase
VQANISNTCVVLNSDGSLDVVVDKRLEVSAMAPGAVLLQLVLSEVCGTDVHLQHGRLDTVPYPIIPGHVAVGRVYATAGCIADVEGSNVRT